MRKQISFLVTVLLYKLSCFIRLIKLGAGETWPGHIILKIYPQFLQNTLPLFGDSVIYISGTNGKTSTCKTLSDFLMSCGLVVCTNSSGANLVNGVASALITYISKHKKNKPNPQSYCVLEVDEGSLPFLVKTYAPRYILLTNLSRDQLDRYGEVDITIERWAQALNSLKKQTTVIFYNNDSNLIKLRGLVVNKNIDFIPSSGKELFLESGHIKSFFNVNISLSFLLLNLLGFKKEDFISFLKKMPPAFGRAEIFKTEEGESQIFLAKNPASFNENLNYLTNHNTQSFNLLYVLNDNIPDGLDVSWIYDIDSDSLLNITKAAKKVFVSGKRAYDFALRLKIAGCFIPNENISLSLKESLSKALDKDRRLYILPTYSAMLEVRKFLGGKKIL